MKPEDTAHAKSAGMFSNHATQGVILVVDDESDMTAFGRIQTRLFATRSGHQEAKRLTV